MSVVIIIELEDRKNFEKIKKELAENGFKFLGGKNAMPPFTFEGDNIPQEENGFRVIRTISLG